MTTPEELEEAKAWAEDAIRQLKDGQPSRRPFAAQAVLLHTLLSAVSGDGWRPEGWVLVPKVPTTEQRRKNAARVAIMLRAVTGKDFAGWDFADDLYDQFVRAAPPPPVPEGT